MQNKILNFVPAYLATASLSTVQAGGNVLNSAVSTLTAGGIGFVGTQPFIILKHVRISNALTTVSVNVSLYKGATISSVGGTQFAFTSVAVPANSYLDWYGQHRFDFADYLTGYSNLPNSVVINMDGEIGLA